MGEVKVKVPKENFVSTHFDFIFSRGDTDKYIQLLSGGRGSGKSISICQNLVIGACRRRIRVALVRKVYNTIKESQFQDIKKVCESFAIENTARFTVSPLEIKMSNGSHFICRGLDKPEKIKSLSEVDVIWIEEATELKYEDWITLSFSIRGKGKKKIILSWNPKYDHWINDEFFYSDGSLRDTDNVFHSHSTYLDNPFVGKDFIRNMEDLRSKDIDLFNIVALGKMQQVRGLIFPNYTLIDEMPRFSDGGAYGVDPGFNDPYSVVNTVVSGDNVYWDEVLYSKQKTTSEVLQMLNLLGVNKNRPFRIDDSRPDIVKDFRDAGYNASSARKGGIKQGIDKLKSRNLFITKSSTNLLKEIATYKWLEDSKGTVLDEPVDLFNHAMDSARYGSLYYLNNAIHPDNGAKTLGFKRSK